MDSETNIAKNTILETLSLKQASEGQKENLKSLFSCMFCDQTEEFKHDNKAILQHMFMEHRTVIADVQEIRDMKEYLEFWKKEFKGKNSIINPVETQNYNKLTFSFSLFHIRPAT